MQRRSTSRRSMHASYLLSHTRRHTDYRVYAGRERNKGSRMKRRSYNEFFNCLDVVQPGVLTNCRVAFPRSLTNERGLKSRVCTWCTHLERSKKAAGLDPLTGREPRLSGYRCRVSDVRRQMSDVWRHAMPSPCQSPTSARRLSSLHSQVSSLCEHAFLSTIFSSPGLLTTDHRRRRQKMHDFLLTLTSDHSPHVSAS